jgi:hypothetical protein
LAAATLLGRGRGRSITVRDDDVFLVSYPRSGNTWLRFLVGNLVSRNEPTTFANIEERVPDIYRNTDRRLARMSSPRILKSHEYFDPRYKKVVYVVRDPRDVAVSYYFYLMNSGQIPADHPMDLFVQDYVSGKLDAFGSWGEHVGSWLGARRPGEDTLLVRYEDLICQINLEVKRLAAFLGLRVTEATLEQAISESSFQTMRRLEAEQAHMWETTAQTSGSIPFVREGKIGAGKSHLGEDSLDLIQRAWSQQMQRFAYGRE